MDWREGLTGSSFIFRLAFLCLHPTFHLHQGSLVLGRLAWQLGSLRTGGGRSITQRGTQRNLMFLMQKWVGWSMSESSLPLCPISYGALICVLMSSLSLSSANVFVSCRSCQIPCSSYGAPILFSILFFPFLFLLLRLIVWCFFAILKVCARRLFFLMRDNPARGTG